MPAPTGAHTTLWYKWEDGFGNAPASGDAKKPYGGDASLTQFEGSNNAVDIFQPNSREMAQIIEQHFDGSFSIDFEITNPWWLQAVISKASTTDNGDGTYTHEFTGDLPRPMRIYAGYEANATSSGDPGRRVLEGCIVQQATIDTSVEDTASASISGAYINESWETLTSLDAQPELNHDVMNYADAMLSLGGSTLSLVQDASVEINNNTDIIRELGTRIGVDYSPKARVPSVDYTKIREDNSEVEDMYGSQAASAVQETVDSDKPMSYSLDNGKSAGNGKNTMSLDMDGAFPESLSTENLGNPQEDLQESINRRLRTITVSATNEVESAL